MNLPLPSILLASAETGLAVPPGFANAALRDHNQRIAQRRTSGAIDQHRPNNGLGVAVFGRLASAKNHQKQQKTGAHVHGLSMIARMRKRVYNPPDMTPETEEAPQGMGEVSRIAGVFFEPKKTFEDIARRPTFLVPLALVILFGLAFGMAVSQRIGARQLAQQQIEKNPRYDQMTPEQRQNGVELGAKISSVLLYVGPIIAAPLATLVIAGVLLGIVAGIMSAPVRFNRFLRWWPGGFAAYHIFRAGDCCAFYEEPHGLQHSKPAGLQSRRIYGSTEGRCLHHRQRIRSLHVVGNISYGDRSQGCGRQEAVLRRRAVFGGATVACRSNDPGGVCGIFQLGGTGDRQFRPCAR